MGTSYCEMGDGRGRAQGETIVGNPWAGAHGKARLLVPVGTRVTPRPPDRTRRALQRTGLPPRVMTANRWLG